MSLDGFIAMRPILPSAFIGFVQLDHVVDCFQLARQLFPSNRKLYIDAMGVAVEQSVRLFEPGELGSPQSLADWLNTQYRVARPMARVQAKDFPFQNVSYTASV
jgi:hypothetical protein